MRRRHLGHWRSTAALCTAALILRLISWARSSSVIRSPRPRLHPQARLSPRPPRPVAHPLSGYLGQCRFATPGARLHPVPDPADTPARSSRTRPGPYNRESVADAAARSRGNHPKIGQRYDPVDGAQKVIRGIRTIFLGDRRIVVDVLARDARARERRENFEAVAELGEPFRHALDLVGARVHVKRMPTADPLTYLHHSNHWMLSSPSSPSASAGISFFKCSSTRVCFLNSTPPAS